MKTKTVLLLSIFLFAGCGNKTREIQHEGWVEVVQQGGRTLGYSPSSGVGLLYTDGWVFKDLDRDGELDMYEDWRLSMSERAEDLASKMSIEEIAGLMLYSGHQSIPFNRAKYDGKSWPESGADTSALSDDQKHFLSEDNLRHVLVTSVSSPRVAAQWNNNLQAFVEGLGHGIPANNSSDPRHESRPTDEFNAGNGGHISIWPTPLGLAATFDPEVVRTFGEIASVEYRALGLATTLSPQTDIATDPRWRRSMGTFGEDPRLVADMSRAYIDAFQTSSGKEEIENGWGYGSVNCMVKHWPGGGSGEGGRDAHLGFGKYAVFPGDKMQLGIDAFVKGAFTLDGPTLSASAVMPYYTISFGQDPSGENVGNSFSHYMITDILRDKYAFDGVVCTDWGITRDYKEVYYHDGKPWGVEGLSVAERHYEILKAGVDQFGGNNKKEPVLEAYKLWARDFGKESADERFRISARRLLLNFFRTGLFDNPYVDVEKSAETVGCQEYMKKGYEAQLKSVVMLKNHGGALPKKGPLKVYHPKEQIPNVYSIGGGVSKKGGYDWPIAPDIINKYYIFTDDIREADFAIVEISEPVSGRGFDKKDLEVGGNGYMPISLQWEDYTAESAREVSVAGGDPKEKSTNRSYKGKTIQTENKSDLELIRETRKGLGDKPLVVILPCSKPSVLSEIEPMADAILISFGATPYAYLDIISGAYEPSGLLPMQFPASMETVEAQFEDTPRDMVPYEDSDGNKYDFAFGMNFSGIINDGRVAKYY